MPIIKKFKKKKEKRTYLISLEQGATFRSASTTLESAIAGDDTLWIVAEQDNRSPGRATIISLDGKEVRRRDGGHIVIQHPTIKTRGEDGKEVELSRLDIGDTFIFTSLTEEKRTDVWMKIAPIGAEKAGSTYCFSFEQKKIVEWDNDHRVITCSYEIQVKEAETE